MSLPVRAVVLALVVALLSVACAADTDPELTLLPAETTIAPTIPEGSEDDDETTPEPSPTTTTTEPIVTTTTTVPDVRIGNPRRASTEAGDVLGVRSEEVVKFRAIPYAAPPVGQLRFAAPEPSPAFDGTFQANRPGFACPQGGADASIQFFPVPDTDENCLTLDVFTPATGDALPVMVWLHDGNFVSGSAHSEAYEGSILAREEVVVVNVNSRVDALGYLVFDETANSADGAGFANRGFQDQVAALTWVQQNIVDFGGDPSNVTIIGQGSGAKSVCGHLASTSSVGLFHKAILQSGGSCDSMLTIEEAVQRGQAWLEETSCAEAQFIEGCLQFLEIDDLLAASAASGIGFDLVADGVNFDRNAFSLASTDELGDVPLLIGSNLDDGTLFTVGADEPTDQELRDLVLIELGSNTDLLLSQYEGLETNLEKQATFITDSRYACASDRFANVAGDDTVVYTYQIIHRSVDVPLSLGATHGVETVWLFGNSSEAAGFNNEALDPDDLFVAEFIRSVWTTFAADGTPGGDVDWPPYLESSPAHLLIGLESSVSATLQDGRCEILAAPQQ